MLFVKQREKAMVEKLRNFVMNLNIFRKTSENKM